MAKHKSTPAPSAKKAIRFFTAWQYDEAVRASHGSLVCGVDEAGRGPLAGPVVAAAVILPGNLHDAPFYDSKQLSKTEREYAYEMIMAQALTFGIGIVDPGFIDRYNILQATYQAMRQALLHMSITPQLVLVDGTIIPGIAYAQRKLVRGDALSQSIAAASILAKVTRDRLMAQFAEEFPGYGFAKHAGYGTPEHLSALRQKGPCPIHRLTFAPVRAVLESQEHRESSQEAAVADDMRQAYGQRGEDAAIAHLLAKGYRLRERRWRVALGEVDAIMEDGPILVFVEVRARAGVTASHSLMEAAQSVDGKKQRRIKKLAAWYLQLLPEATFTEVRYDVVVVTWEKQSSTPCLEHYIDAFG